MPLRWWLLPCSPSPHENARFDTACSGDSAHPRVISTHQLPYF
jgi:hypothetical protein